MKLQQNYWLMGLGLLMVATPAFSETPVTPTAVQNTQEDEMIFRRVVSTPEASPETQTPQPTSNNATEEVLNNSRDVTEATGEVLGDPVSPLESGSFSNQRETQLSQTPTPTESPTPTPTETPTPSNNIDLSPEIIEGSPVLQRWLQEVPNVLHEIRNDPSFRTRIRLGYSQFPSTGQAGGFNAGVEDIFIGRTGLTLSGDYQRSFNGDREAYGADLRYYVLPLGGYINVAPVVGYRNLYTTRYSTDGLNLGLRLLLVPSRTGAADLSLTQTFVRPFSGGEDVGITTFSIGYALTHNLRLSTDIEKQNSTERKDSRVGISFEWMP